jgi:hypothetical protein
MPSEKAAFFSLSSFAAVGNADLRALSRLTPWQPPRIRIPQQLDSDGQSRLRLRGPSY